MKNIKFLLLGTSLSCFPQLAYTQCVTVQDCTALGYTESSCNGGKGVKCPFGNGWFCAEDTSTVCDKNGFKYSCTGTGYSGGSGQPCGGKYKTCNCATNYAWNGSSCALSCSSSYQYTCTGTGYAGGTGAACGGKYTQCTCSSGYEWKDGKCQKEALNGAQGDLYYCNGAVVAVKTPDMDFYVSLKELEWVTWTSGCSSNISCNNIKCGLPTKEQLEQIYYNKPKLNVLLQTNNGPLLKNYYYWSSSSKRDKLYYVVSLSDGDIDYDFYTAYARPILYN